MILVFMAYSTGSYSYILFRGWNITINEWLNPLAGFTWASDPGCIPDTQVMPGGPGGDCGGKASSPSGACAGLGLNETTLLKILINPADEVKLAECAGQKTAQEVTSIAKDLWHWIKGPAKDVTTNPQVSSQLPGPAGEIVPGISTIVGWIKGLF